jgi:BASS family bile acid:Na+ symporter
LAAAALFAPAAGSRVRLQGLVARPDAAIGTVGCPSCNLCLLFNLNFTLVAYWNQFVQTWGTESYIAALAGPFIGLGCGYLLVSGLRVKDAGIRHAAEVTTAVRNIAPMLLMMIFPFAADPLVTVSITILNTIGIVIVLLFVLMWRRAASPSDTHATTNQPASEGLPPPTST